MYLKIYYFIFIVVINISLAWHTSAAQTNENTSWPAVSPLRANFTISTDQPHVETTIFSVEGKPLYRLTCHPGDYIDEYGSDYDHMYHCKMIPINSKDKIFDLFKPTENWNRSRTRALFHGEQLIGGCKKHPYYGSKRIFLMRNMEVTLEVAKYNSPSMTDMLTGKEKPYFSFHLIVDIKPAPHALSSHALPVPEICESSYKLNKKGIAEEKILIDRDSAHSLEETGVEPR